MAKITVRTNGQTLTVNASVSHWTTAALAVTASGDDDIPSTTTTTITADYDMHFSNTATTAVVTVKQLDGTTLLAQTFEVNPGVGPRVLNPAPDPYQLASDAVRGFAGHRKIITGNYYGPPVTANGTSAPGTGVLVMTPFWVPEAFTADRIGCDVSGATATAVVRLGIFANTEGTDLPGALVLDAGATIDGNSATVQEITIDQDLTRGLYWLGAASQVASCTLRTIGVMDQPPVAAATFSGSATSTGNNCYTKSGVTGAFSAGGYTSLTTATNGIKIRVRAA